jgi:hypothetical protein
MTTDDRNCKFKGPDGSIVEFVKMPDKYQLKNYEYSPPDAFRSGDDFPYALYLSQLPIKVGNLPATYSIRNQMFGVRNQNGQSACVAYAASAIVEYHARKYSDLVFRLSPQYIYDQRPNTRNQGLNWDDVCERLESKGVCLDRDNRTVGKRILTAARASKDADAHAKIFKTLSHHSIGRRAGFEPWDHSDAINGVIKNYAKLILNPHIKSKLTKDDVFNANILLNERNIFVNEIKSALVNVGPVSITVPVWDKIMYWDRNTKTLTTVPNKLPQFWTPDPNFQPKLLGHHALVIDGYDDVEGTFGIRNSWGKSWGTDGFTCMPYICILESLTDALVITPIVNMSQMSQLPTPWDGTNRCWSAWFNGGFYAAPKGAVTKQSTSRQQCAKMLVESDFDFAMHADFKGKENTCYLGNNKGNAGSTCLLSGRSMSGPLARGWGLMMNDMKQVDRL